MTPRTFRDHDLGCGNGTYFVNLAVPGSKLT
jgi:hypothetical protein